ncbi:MAG: EpsG family protein, partial [Peptococcaceae bacterium]|nr:EpsG family protein [Peptococcaceae bacterium]
MGIAGAFLAYYAQKTNKTRYVWLMVLCLSVIAGLRSVNVGIDTKTYNQMFINIAAGNYGDVFGAEKTFVWIVRFLQIIIKSPVYVFLMLSLLTNTLIIFRLWDFRKQTSFLIAFAYY